VDKIWQTPLYLPPPEIPGLSQIEQGSIDEFKKSLGLEGTVVSNIVGSNNKMSINGLVWLEAGGKVSAADKDTGGTGDEVGPDGQLKKSGASNLNPEQKKQRMEANRKSFVEIFDGILDKKRLDDDAFRATYPNLNGTTLVGNLLAWMDPETKEDGDGRGKTEYYSAVQPTPYSLKDAPIANESEYNMVKGFDDTITRLVSDNFTIQMTNSLNVNKAAMLLIGGLIPELNPDALDQIEKRRSDPLKGGEFKDEADFWTFVNTLGSYDDAKANFTKKGLKILSEETSYRVVISAESGMAKKIWVADIGPPPPKENTGPPQAAPPTAPQNPEGTAPPTPAESSDTESLDILYLRAD